MLKSKKATIITSAACTVCLVAALAACAPQTNSEPAADTGSSNTATTAEKPVAEPVETPEADEFGVVVADAWKDAYPHQYETYKQNEENSPESGKDNYLETYPALNTMYKGYGFAKGYDEAASHSYTPESIKATPRVNEKTLANCITCKTPQFTAKVNAEGDEVYAIPFADMIDMFNEPISCWNCHENEPTELVVPSKFYLTSLGEAANTTPVEAQVCGQCHNEYYFNADKVTSNPYVGTDEMTAEQMLAFYDGLEFSDWEHPDTGAAMLKAQHPEFETIYGGKQSHMASLGYSCADCHMGTQTAADGTTFSNHNLVSPLENDAVLENCSSCHKDLPSQVAAWQAEVTEREHELSEEIERYINELAAQKDTLSADDLARAQEIHRHAQFYWDFVMVENSEGAHNPDAAHENLDKCEELLEEGFALLA